MKTFIYNSLIWLAERVRPARRTVNIKSVEHLEELIEQGFKINNLEILAHDVPSASELNPLNMTLKKLVIHALESNATTLRGAITLADREEPEILYYVVYTEDLVKKVNSLLEKFEEENL
jgi:hypothetical protein